MNPNPLRQTSTTAYLNSSIGQARFTKMVNFVVEYWKPPNPSSGRLPLHAFLRQPWGDICVELTNMKHGQQKGVSSFLSPKAETPCFVLQGTPSSFRSRAPKLHLKFCLSEASCRSFLSLKSWYAEILPPLFYTAANWVENFSSSSLCWIVHTSCPNHKTSLQALGPKPYKHGCISSWDTHWGWAELKSQPVVQGVH